jgi:DNA-binding FadR family transcriptional regulator
MPTVKIKNIHGGTLDALGAALIRGDYQPGDKLPPEASLCELFGVSRTILREVVKSLVAKGLITTGPKIGTIVQPSERWNWFDRDVVAWQARVGLSPQLLDDLQELRSVIEPQAVSLACKRATAEDVQALEDAYAGMKAAVEGGTLTDYIRHDEAFHIGLLRASHNQMFLQMGQALAALLKQGFAIASRTPDQGIARSLPYHRAIVDAIRSGDAQQGYERSRFLIDSARDDVRSVLASEKV